MNVPVVSLHFNRAGQQIYLHFIELSFKPCDLCLESLYFDCKRCGSVIILFNIMFCFATQNTLYAERSLAGHENDLLQLTKSLTDYIKIEADTVARLALPLLPRVTMHW
jgi:hypothetical protein